MRRHVYYYTHILEFDGSLEDRFRDDPATWLPPPALRLGERWRVDLHADGVLMAPLALQEAEVQISPAHQPTDCLMRAVSWHSTRADRLFPVFTGDLELSALPFTGWQLTLAGAYRPPLSVIGGTADHVLGHRVAEACVRRFVLDVADRLALATLPA